jgi:CDP-diacylglycerol--glycerol-3-phosphate 3-phosphatidyltransferase
LRSSVLVLIGVLGAAFLSMGVYGAVGRGRDADATRKGTHLFLGGLDFLVHWFLWALAPAERLFLSLGFTPDVFNFTGLGFGLASGVALGMGELELGGWAIALGGISDILDGRIARALNVASPYGKFIDSTLDRFVEVFAFLGLVVYFRDRPIGAFLAAASMAGSLLVSYAQARGETVAVSGSGGLMQRAERLVLMCLVCLIDPTLSARWGWREGTAVLAVLALMAVATFATAVHRTVWIARRLRS